MADDIDELYPYHRSIVDELFIKTADDSYVAARWCYANGFDVDFFWLAGHALEKYLKAVLFLNGRSWQDRDRGREEVQLWPRHCAALR